MSTAAQIREDAYRTAYEAQPVPTPSRRRGDPRKHVARLAVEDAQRAIKHAVITGEGLQEPVDTDLQLHPAASVLSGAGGVILPRLGGLPISREAASAGRFVTVVFRGEHVAMTIDEAFDRGLREDASWNVPCDEDEVIDALTHNVVSVTRGALRDTAP